jgi:signal transduction histidine kinase
VIARTRHGDECAATLPAVHATFRPTAGNDLNAAPGKVLMNVHPDERGAVSRPGADIPTLLLYGGAGLCAFFAGYQLLEVYVLIPRFGTHMLYLLHMLRGITASILLASFASWYLIQHPTIVRRQRFDATRGGFLESREWKGEHLRWFIQMRWVASGFALALIVIAVPLTGILSAEHLPQLLIFWGILVVTNFLFLHALQRGFDFERQVIAQSVVDLAVLTGMLNASGGIENPLSVAYLFHVIIASILLPKRKAIGVAVFGSATFTFLALGELFQILPHATILLFPHSVGMSGGHMNVIHAAHEPVFVTGRVLSFLGVMLLTAYFTTLVTERLRESEADLEAGARKAILEQRRLEGVIDAAGLGIAIVGTDGVLSWVNARLAEWLEWPATAIGAACPHDHSHPHHCLACAATRTLQHDEQAESDVALSANNGRLRYFRCLTSPVHDADGRAVQAVAVVEDVTARKALEAEALHAGRLAVLGQLAAGIAHEIGNPLSSLHARLQLMKRRNDPEFHRQSIDVLQSQIDRIGRIVRNVSHLAQGVRDGWTTVDVNAVAGEALSLVRLDARAAEVRFSERLQPALAPVRGVRDQILQVTLNLLLNAVEAMPDGGTLEVATTVEDQRVRVAITDSGLGIDENVRARLFEPFFTTKSEGTGLGLSICYSLVHAHGGTIDVSSQPGQGSCFTINLPIAAAVAAAVAARSPHP